MKVDHIFQWIRLGAGVILEFIPPPSAVGDETRFGPGPTSGLKPERIQLWLRILAQAALVTLDGFGDPSELKPERIRFWLQLIGRFVLAVLAGADGETGKSGATEVNV